MRPTLEKMVAERVGNIMIPNQSGGRPPSARAAARTSAPLGTVPRATARNMALLRAALLPALLMFSAPAALAAAPAAKAAADDCDPIVINGASKQQVTSAPAKVVKVSKSTKPKTKIKKAARKSTKPRKAKPKVVTASAAPEEIPGACPGAGKNADQIATLLDDIASIAPAGEATPAFPDPAAGGNRIAALSSPPATRISRPSYTPVSTGGTTVPLALGGSGSSGGSGSGSGSGGDDSSGSSSGGSSGGSGSGSSGGSGGGSSSGGSSSSSGITGSSGTTVKVPEPGSVTLMLGGLAGLALAGRRRHRPTSSSRPD